MEPTREPARLPSRLRRLRLAMLAFGLAVGVVFPLFVRGLLGADEALSPLFFGLCVLAGLLVGGFNFLLFVLVVHRKLKRVANAMRHIVSAVSETANGAEACADGCRLEVDSRDALGDMQAAFNAMTAAVETRLASEVTVRRFLADLATSVELEEVARTLVESFLRIEGSVGAVLFAGPEGNMQRLASAGLDEDGAGLAQLDRRHGPVARALDTGRLVRVAPLREELAWVRVSTPFGECPPRAVSLLPLVAEQRVVGLLAMAHASPEIPAEKLALLETLRLQAGQLLQNAILHRKLRDLAALDELTQILNRRFGFRRLTEEFSRALRHSAPLSVVLFDVDHFKRFNDTFGHDAGDEVLRRVAKQIEGSIRAGDIVCRYGGEEFLVVFPGAGSKDALQLAERMRRQVEALSLPWAGSTLSVTISLGVASWPSLRAESAEALVTRADSAMYVAKRGGRNRAALASEAEGAEVRELLPKAAS